MFNVDGTNVIKYPKVVGEAIVGNEPSLEMFSQNPVVVV